MSLTSRSTLGLGLAALLFALPGCRKSQTAKDIKKFAEKVCACKDKACAEAVQTEFLAWTKENQRARGSEGDRKSVEKAMQRYAECHLALVGPEKPKAPTVPVPKVNLQPGAAKAPTAVPAPETAGAPASEGGEAKPAAEAATSAPSAKPE